MNVSCPGLAFSPDGIAIHIAVSAAVASTTAVWQVLETGCLDWTSEEGSEEGGKEDKQFLHFFCVVGWS